MDTSIVETIDMSSLKSALTTGSLSQQVKHWLIFNNNNFIVFNVEWGNIELYWVEITLNGEE
jgi:hypothetical protein